MLKNILSQPHRQSQLLWTSSYRNFSEVHPEKPLSYEESTGESNVLKGQHVRYIPKKRLHFDFSSPEGPLSLIYHASDALHIKAIFWKISTMITLPAAYMAYLTLSS